MADGGDNVIPFKNPDQIEEEPPTSIRHDIIMEAAKLIDGPRHETYGAAATNLGNTGDLWTKYAGRRLDAHDVAIMNILQKVSRIMCGHRHRDNYTDIVGYAAIAGELADGT